MKEKFNIKRKAVLIIVLVLVLLGALLVDAKLKNSNPLVESIGEETGLKKDELSEINPQELEEYYAVYKNPNVIALRQALDMYRTGDTSLYPDVTILEAAVSEDKRDGIITGLDSFDKKYYESKFVVLTINQNIGGGADIQIMFQDRPDRIFYGWVYELAGGGFELRGFNSKEYFDPKVMKELNKAYEVFLSDTEHAL